MPGLQELILALDDKFSLRSGDRAAGPRLLVSAFLAREPCAAKSNGITAIPRLLGRMVLEGAVVTIDAAGCQRAIVQNLQAAGADSVLAVKRNQSTLIRVRTERRGPRTRQRSMRYCISSRPVDAKALLELVRGHWDVENGLHRTLDVQFREDDCRLRRGHAPAVMGIPGRAALNMVARFNRIPDRICPSGCCGTRSGATPPCWPRSGPERGFSVALPGLRPSKATTRSVV